MARFSALSLERERQGAGSLRVRGSRANFPGKPAAARKSVPPFPSPGTGRRERSIGVSRNLSFNY